MRARTEATIAPGGRLTHLACQPPLTLRRVTAERADTCALCLVGTAAGPLAGDGFELCLDVLDDAAATLQATGASLAQGRGGAPGSLRTGLRVGERARLAGRPGPVIVAHGAQVDVTLTVDLAATAALDWREIVVLGRANEPPGAATLRWDVTRAGRPVLRQFVDLADPALAAWPGMVSGARVLASALVTDPSLEARTVVGDDTAVCARLDDTTALVTVLDRDAARATSRMSALLDRVTSRAALSAS